MSNTWFQFKQFRIEQDQCAMKVGTDGVLLGAWADLSGLKEGASVLDVGTGTGLIALMAAQRCLANIDAIEIEPSAAGQASENFKKSRWADRLRIIHGDFRHEVSLGDQSYDHVLSNPPFFSQSLSAPDQKRNLARHDDSLSTRDLAQGLPHRLKKEGKVSLILPADRFLKMDKNFTRQGLFLRRKCLVLSHKSKVPIRVLAEWGRVRGDVEEQTLSVFSDTRKDYSEAYQQLTKEFYPGF